MKFLPAEHKSISDLLMGKGYAENEFSFRKSKGLLHIEVKGRKDTFCYYRKTESVLDGNLKFEDQTRYYLGPKKNMMVSDWYMVLDAIAAWVNDPWLDLL